MKNLIFKRKIYRSSINRKIQVCSICIFLSLFSLYFFSCSNDDETFPGKSKEMIYDKTFNNELYETLKSDTLFKASCKAFNIREIIFLKQKEKIDLETAFYLIQELRKKYNWYYMYNYIAKYNLEEFEKLKNNNSNLKYGGDVTIYPFEQLACTYIDMAMTICGSIHSEFGQNIHSTVDKSYRAHPERMLNGRNVRDFIPFLRTFSEDEYVYKLVIILMLDTNTHTFSGNGSDLYFLFEDFNIKNFGEEMRIVSGIFDYYLTKLENYKRDHSGGSSTNPTIPGGTGTPTPPPLINELHPSFINTESKCVYDKLVKKPNIIFTKLIKGFKSLDSKSDVTIVVDELEDKDGKKIYGKVVPDINKNKINYILHINQDVDTTKTPVEIARVLLHEAFHLYIFGKIHQEDLHNGLCDEPNFKQDYETYKNTYSLELESENKDGFEKANLQVDGGPHHNYMVEHYMFFMKEGLKDFIFSDQEYVTALNEALKEDANDFEKQNELIECLAWGGLSDTPEYKRRFKDKDNKNLEKNKKALNKSRRFLVYLPGKCN